MFSSCIVLKGVYSLEVKEKYIRLLTHNIIYTTLLSKWIIIF